MIKNYKDESEENIIYHGQEAIGRSFKELIIEYDGDVESLMKKAKSNKGLIGNLFQYAYYGIPINPDKIPDFEKAGIELKVTGYRINKNESLSADQRLVLSGIDFQDYVDDVAIENSTLSKKCKRMLVFCFLIEDDTKDRVDCIVKYMFDYKLFKIPKEDLKIIEADYKKIVDKIKDGRACDISEADTSFLSACRRDGGEVGYIVDGIEYKALPRRFAFKNSYITYLLNDYIKPGRPCDAPKKKKSKKRDIKIAKGRTFEQYVESTIKKYRGKTAARIANRKAVNYKGFNSSKDKDKYSRLAFKMFGIDSNNAEYLIKSATTIKAIRISKNNHIDESVSFPPFLFKDIVTESVWIESKTYDYLSERRFLFIIFKENDKGDYVLLDSEIFYLSADVLDEYFKPVWEKTITLLKNGFEIKKEKYGKEYRYYNPLPGMSENGVCHIRPHSTKSAYKLKDGTIKGDWKKYANEMPDGQWMTTQSFWINNTYLMKILEKYM